MEVKVLNVISQQDSQNCVVDFITPFGSGRAEWYGDPPRLLHSYEVELTIEEDLVWGDGITAATKEGTIIDYQNEVLTLRGELEALYPDGGADIRIGDSILMIITKGTPPEIGTLIEIQPKRLILYPHDEYGVLPTKDWQYQQTRTPSKLISSGKSGERIVLDTPISQPKDTFNLATYREFLVQHESLYTKYSALYDSLGRHKSIQEQLKSPEREKLGLLDYQFKSLRQEYFRRLPIHLLARCPYCGSRILQPFDSFSLVGFYPFINLPDLYHGHLDLGTGPFPMQQCSHLVVATLSINLNGLIPDDLPAWVLKRKSLPLTSNPDVMVWPLLARKTSAVLHRLPIGRLDDPAPLHRYTAYFTTYFADDTSNLYTEEMWVPTDLGGPATGGVLYDTNLVKWVKAGRLFWLDPEHPDHPPVREPVDVFPYANIQPQGWYEIVENGQINGPHPYYKVWQGEAPRHDQSFPKTIE